jgi:hypothetical protein
VYRRGTSRCLAAVDAGSLGPYGAGSDVARLNLDLVADLVVRFVSSSVVQVQAVGSPR